MIHINQLQNLSKEQIVDVLLDQKIQPFKICVPKESSLFNSESREISIEYLHLAFCGQQLSNVSDEFSYNHVQPSERNDICFKVRTNNLELLSDVLLDISYGYVNDHEDDFYFPELVAEFEGNIEMEGYEVACPEFVKYYREFMKN